MNHKKRFKKLLTPALTILLCTGLQAQSVYVFKKDKQLTVFTIEDVQALSFKNGKFVINKANGNSSELAISDIRHISFTNNQTTTPTEIVEKSATTSLLRCYPNPASSHISIEVAETEAEGTTIEILSVTGQTMHLENHALSNNTYTINTSDYDEGIYLIKTTNQNNINTTTFIKK